MKFDWEDIFIMNYLDTQYATSRAKVEGGWLITNSLIFADKLSTSLTFMPDPEHKWSIENDIPNPRVKISEKDVYAQTVLRTE